MTTFPPSAPAPTASPALVHALLKRPDLVAYRIAQLLEQQMLADFLLTARIPAVGGVVLFEQGWPTVNGEVEQVTPGGEYPTATIERALAQAATAKWATATEITDESIARLALAPVETALGALAVELMRRSNAAAMDAIVAMTASRRFSVAAPWTTADAIVAAVLAAKATAEDADHGVAFDTIVLRPSHYAAVMGSLIAGSVFPREAEGNPLTNGQWPTFLGLTWVSSPRADSNPLLADRDRLGALAFEEIGGPYKRDAASGVESQVIRVAERDAYRIQARRVVAAAVLDPTAALWLDGTGL